MSQREELDPKHSPGPASAVTVLSAGGTVARAASEARGTFPNVDDTTRPTTRRRLCPADEQPQCRVVRALRLALGQRLTLDRPEPRATPGSTTATTTFKRLGVSNTIPSSTGPPPVTCTRSPIASFSTTRAYRAASARPGIARAPSSRARRYCGLIDDTRHRPRPTARDLARAVDGGRHVNAALRHLDVHASDPEAQRVADALARFLVARCDSHHAGWRVVRQVVVDSAADAPWEKCARRAVPMVADDLIALAGTAGRTQLPHAQHIAAQRRAEQIASHVDQPADPYRSRAEMRCSDTGPLAPGARLCRSGPAHASKSREPWIALCRVADRQRGALKPRRMSTQLPVRSSSTTLDPSRTAAAWI